MTLEDKAAHEIVVPIKINDLLLGTVLVKVKVFVGLCKIPSIFIGFSRANVKRLRTDRFLQWM